MTAPAAGCLDVDELVAMSEGSLPPDRIDAVISHVDGCPDCAEVVAGLGGFERGASEVGRYRLEKVLGAGGMGIVHAAWDPELRRRVAVKLVHPHNADRAARARMLREARALARINHPNVVAVHDVGEHADGVYVATELVDGETLATWCARRPPAEIVAAWVQVARGLAAAHAEGVIHRDVKPSNALVSRDGRVRIGDFGLARRASAGDSIDVRPPGLAVGSGDPAGSGAVRSTDERDADTDTELGAASTQVAIETPAGPGGPPRAAAASSPRAGDDSLDIGSQVTDVGSVVGTPAYMAPEQRSGSVDARSDQFALCVALTEALTGKRPRADDAVSLPGSIGAGRLTSVLRRGLRRSPAARFPSMTALADALALAIAPRPSRLRRLLPLGGLVLLGGALAAFALFGRASRAPGDQCEVAALPGNLWTPARRSALGALPGRLERRLDTWVAAWTAASADVCAAAPADPPVRARQRACLAASADALAGLLARWDAAPPRDPMPAHGAIDAVPRVSRCSRASVAAGPWPTPSQAIRIHILRPWVAAAASPEAAAHFVDSARAIGHPPFVVEAMIGLAGREAPDDRDAAITTLRAALGVAERAGGGWSLVDASIPLIGLLGADGTREAVALADAARARIAALGGDASVEAELDYALGDVWRDARRHEEATVALERALRGFRAAYGPDDPHEAITLVALGGVQAARDSEDPRARATMDRAQAILVASRIDMPVTLPRDPAGLVAQTKQLLEMARAAGGPDSEAVVGAHYNLAIAYTLEDERERALEEYRTASRLGEKLGLRDARMVESLSQSAALLTELGRAPEAIAPARRAVRRAEELDLPSELGASLTILGAALVDAGQPAEAREPLRRALSIRERLKESGRFRGNTRFQLARATWSSDRARARGLAEAARLDMVGFLDGITDDDPNAAILRKTQEERIAEVDRWMAQHR